MWPEYWHVGTHVLAWPIDQISLLYMYICIFIYTEFASTERRFPWALRYSRFVDLPSENLDEKLYRFLKGYRFSYISYFIWLCPWEADWFLFYSATDIRCRCHTFQIFCREWYYRTRYYSLFIIIHKEWLGINTQNDVAEINPNYY